MILILLLLLVFRIYLSRFLYRAVGIILVGFIIWFMLYLIRGLRWFALRLDCRKSRGFRIKRQVVVYQLLLLMNWNLLIFLRCTYLLLINLNWSHSTLILSRWLCFRYGCNLWSSTWCNWSPQVCDVGISQEQYASPHLNRRGQHKFLANIE